MLFGDGDPERLVLDIVPPPVIAMRRTALLAIGSVFGLAPGWV